MAADCAPDQPQMGQLKASLSPGKEAAVPIKRAAAVAHQRLSLAAMADRRADDRRAHERPVD